MVDPDAPLSDDELDDLESEFLWLAFGPGADRSGGVDYAAEYARAGLPMTVSRGGSIIRIYPDGREEILKRLPTVPYTLPPGVRIRDASMHGGPAALAAVRDRLCRELRRREAVERAARTASDPPA